ncbi:MAG: type II toxin-antitoxin system VapC family toxin [Candidatus Binatia bacterium]
MKFWDSSAIVPLLVREPSSAAIHRMARTDAHFVVWRLTAAEVLSALWRRRRASELDESAGVAAEERLALLERAWTCVDDLAHVDRRARRLLALHDLRAADALQLAAALVACDEQPRLLPFVTLDRRLADAARREGFGVLPAA